MAARNPISRSSIDRVLARAVAIGAVVFGAQTIPFAIEQSHLLMPVWWWFVGFGFFASLTAAAIAGVTLRRVEVSTASVAIVFVVALLTWPLAVRDPSFVEPVQPWLWYIVNLVLAAAAVAFSAPVATFYLFVIPMLYGAVRLTPSGGGASLGRATLDTVYVIILGGGVLILITLLRRAAGEVDSAQSGAITRYASAVRAHALEVERVSVDSIVHDSVLTTLLTGGRAYSEPERALATAMANGTLHKLQQATMAQSAEGSETRLADLRDELAASAEEMGVDVQMRSRDLHGVVPSAAAEALQSAALQALMNSVQHAGSGEVRRWIGVAGTLDGVAIEVGDDGDGFDVAALGTERLGVRVSIRERLANAGGEAVVESAIGEGTLITLVWPR